MMSDDGLNMFGEDSAKVGDPASRGSQLHAKKPNGAVIKENTQKLNFIEEADNFHSKDKLNPFHISQTKNSARPIPKETVHKTPSSPAVFEKGLVSENQLNHNIFPRAERGPTVQETNLRSEITKLETELQSLIRTRKDLLAGQRTSGHTTPMARGVTEGWRKIEQGYKDALSSKEEENEAMDRELEKMKKEIELIDVEMAYIGTQSDNLVEIQEILQVEEKNLNQELTLFTSKVEKSQAKKADLVHKHRTISYMKRDLANQCLLKPAINQNRNLNSNEVDTQMNYINQRRQTLAITSFDTMRTKQNMAAYEQAFTTYTMLEPNFSMVRKVSDLGYSGIRVVYFKKEMEGGLSAR